jgi:hypothetical protein
MVVKEKRERKERASAGTTGESIKNVFVCVLYRKYTQSTVML